MKIKDIDFGCIDAKHDIEGKTPEEINYFEETFIVPPNFTPEDYLNFDKFYVSGLKGTGKTALLRYLQIKGDKVGINSRFILFKSGFDQYEREKFHNSILSEVQNSDLDSESSDYEQAWRFYLYQSIVKFSSQNDFSPFQKNSHWIDFVDLIESTSPRTNSENASFPKIKKGKIEISKSPKIELEFEISEDKRKLANFSELCRTTDECFKALTPSESRSIIFIDELEFSTSDNHAYRRDALLVRDLIVTVDRLNQTCRANNFNIAFIAAIRTEVLYSTKSLGKEINKALFDFGDTLLWHKYSKDKLQHPLIKIIEARILRSEELNGITAKPNPWERYFKGKYHEKDVREYILDQTWYRPRDLVRLMGVVKKHFKDATEITQRQFDEAKKFYSTESWVELCEELATTLSQDEIEAIARILGRFKNSFNLKQFKDQISELASIYSEVDFLEANNKAGDLLKKLYEVGVIGNYIRGRRGNKVPQYAARGNPRALLEEDFIVHNALKPFFSTNL